VLARLAELNLGRAAKGSSGSDAEGGSA